MKKIFICLYFIIILVCSYIFIFYDKRETKSEYLFTKKIKIDIKGEVNNPGVKELEYNATIEDAINNSNGVTENADLDNINLSKRLHDEEVIIIPTISNNNQDNYVVIEKECSCPVVINSGCINYTFDKIENDNIKISLNNASLEELMTLPGIGESKAKAIIEYRNNQKFKQLSDIMNIKGIGNSIFEKIKDQISL